MVSRVRPALISLTLCCSGLAQAQSDIDAALDGFDEPLSVIVLEAEPPSNVAKNAGWGLLGSFSSSAAYNFVSHDSNTGTDYQGWSKLRNRLNLSIEKQLRADWQFKLNAYAWYDAVYALRDKDYSDEVITAQETDADLQDTYLEGRINDSWDLRAGRQVVNWGFADNLRVLDILNPLDNLEPGLSDIEDIRRPSGMLKLAHFFEPWQLTLIITPEHRFSRNPPFGSDFYSISDAQGQALQYRSEEPEDFRSPNWAVALLGHFSGWDLSLNAARLWHDAAYLDVSGFDTDNLPASLATFNDDVVLKHSRINTVGQGLQLASGSWLFKQEFRYLHALDLTETEIFDVPGQGPTALPSRNSRHNRLDMLLGFEFFGLANTTLAVELAARYLPSFNAGLARSGYKELITESSLRITRDFMNQRLRSTILAIRFDEAGDFAGAAGGALYRISCDYELADNLNLAGGVIWYALGHQQPFMEIADNDRIFGELKYSF